MPVSPVEQDLLPVMYSPNKQKQIFQLPAWSTLLAICVTLYLVQHPSGDGPPRATLGTPSLFRSRAPPSTYSAARNFDSYPWGRGCSPPARARFLSRFSEPARPFGLRHDPPSVEESKNRVLLSAVPHEVGDGLGHRMCILNYELHLALVLGVSYAHRVSSYGSLTVENPQAVEALFGWGFGETSRDAVMESGCEETKLVNDTCEIPSQNVFCAKLRRREHGGKFDRIVVVPDELAECYLDRTQPRETTDERCFPLVRRFLAAYPEPNTLFQMRPKLCFRDYLYTNFSQTAGWFHDKYWRAHSRPGGVDPEDAVPVGLSAAAAAPTNISFSPDRVHIALHVRRGDFFNYTSRVLISDATYADLAARVKVALDEMHGANVPVTVHVYSEGVPRGRGRLKDNHDISSMDHVYSDEHGHRMPDDHWVRLMARNVRLSGPRGVGRGWLRADVQVQTHIATDTVQALHEMLAADFFVGSISGLSVQVVRHIARGLTLLPLPKAEITPDELALNFDYDRNNIPSFVNESALYRKVAEYARANRLACSVW